MTLLADEYELSQYEIIDFLDNKGKVAIVKDKRYKNIWVKKEIDENSLFAYKEIQGISNNAIAYIHKILCNEGKYYVIEEYINGSALKDIVENNGPMKPETVKEIMCQICDGLSCLHKNNIIHRDITPSNIMLTVSGSVKLIDLGISRIKKEYKDRDTTIMGTAGYVPPEQYGFSQTDAASDIYSCGVLMNYLLTGALPNERKYKGNMDFIIKKCLNINPKARYRSAEELKNIILSYKLSKNEFLNLPGFRTNKAWKKIIAMTVYIGLILFCIGDVIFFTERDIYSGIAGIFVIFSIVTAYLLMTDYVYYLERMPAVRNYGSISRKAVGIIFGILFLIICYSINKFILKDILIMLTA